MKLIVIPRLQRALHRSCGLRGHPYADLAGFTRREREIVLAVDLDEWWKGARNLAQAHVVDGRDQAESTKEDRLGPGTLQPSSQLIAHEPTLMPPNCPMGGVTRSSSMA